jgi:hypothetical protein
MVRDLGAVREAVPWQGDVVWKPAMFSQRRPPTVEVALTQERVDV